MKMNKQRLLERFLRYVQVDTAANPGADCYPSSQGQWELGRILLTELNELGLDQVTQDEHGLVTAVVPGNVVGAPVVVLNSHLDTSPETSGAGVKPQVIEAYDGNDIVLPGDSQQVITLAENPELSELIGATLITSDGTTLLGADDKAGIAVIMEVAAFLREHSDVPHGDVRVLFTCDEEIGLGVQHVDVPSLGGTVGYTLDGPEHGQVDVETFSADLATVIIRGKNIHPAIAKDRMVNSIRAMAEFIVRLPKNLAPEATAERDGFLHPYDLSATVERSVVKIILRDFDTDNLQKQADLLGEIASDVRTAHPGCEVEVAIVPQYRNLGDGLLQEPRAVSYVEQAYERLGKTCRRTIIRGGTDGSQFTALGLPTPNLSTGQHNPHSPREFACLDEMVQAAEVLTEILQVWSQG